MPVIIVTATNTPEERKTADAGYTSSKYFFLNNRQMWFSAMYLQPHAVSNTLFGSTHCDNSFMYKY